MGLLSRATRRLSFSTSRIMDIHSNNSSVPDSSRTPRQSVSLHFRDLMRSKKKRRNSAIGRLEAGQSVTTLLLLQWVYQSVISWLKVEMQKHAGDHGRSITPSEDRCAAHVAKRNRNFTPGQLAANLANATGTCFTKNYLRAIKLKGFVCMEACSLHPTSTMPLSREIKLVGTVGPYFLFMNDNAQPNRNIGVSDTLQSENVLRMQWPAYYPNLNPIEYVWYTLVRCVALLV
ncbi:uncharacterized protein TNCV_612871 [Trichonephila clavipes]|nr:uncharacterized protein TNCV_612871 [Trichonephila clavipes]